MWIYVLYFLIIFCSNTVGAISGMGGGVTIKPALDAVGYHSLSAITFYSSAAVFVMSVSSTYKQWKNGVHISKEKVITISFGSILGGWIGDQLFFHLLDILANYEQVQLIQIVLTIFSLLLVLIYTNRKNFSFYLRSNSWFLVVGLLLGSFSTLLGIGGGPINVSLLILCFGLSIKEATVYSIITIFFSQLSKLTSLAFTTGYSEYDLSMLWAILPAALLGGYIGGLLSGRISDKRVTQLFIGVVWLVIIINLMNGIHLIYK